MDNELRDYLDSLSDDDLEKIAGILNTIKGYGIKATKYVAPKRYAGYQQMAESGVRDLQKLNKTQAKSLMKLNPEQAEGVRSLYKAELEQVGKQFPKGGGIPGARGKFVSRNNPGFAKLRNSRLKQLKETSATPMIDKVRAKVNSTSKSKTPKGQGIISRGLGAAAKFIVD